MFKRLNQSLRDDLRSQRRQKRLGRSRNHGVKTLAYCFLLRRVRFSTIGIHQLHLAVILARETLPDGLVPFFEVGNLDFIRYASFLKEMMYQHLSSSLVELSNEFMADQHHIGTMNKVNAGWKNEHRAEKDGQLDVQPIYPPIRSDFAQW